MHCNDEMYRIRSKQKVLILLCLSIAITTSFASTTDFGLATPENNTLMQPQGIQNMSTNATNIVLVHGAWADASGWNKQIPVLRDAGHKVIAVQLPLHSLSEDVETVKRAIALLAAQQFL
jgi:pimeloyl-ACP methyl ester carboxylesterase